MNRCQTTIPRIFHQNIRTSALRLQRPLAYADEHSLRRTPQIQANCHQPLPRRLVFSRRHFSSRSSKIAVRKPNGAIDWNAPGVGILREIISKDNLATWGLVLVRCAYSSQAEWELFLSITQERARKDLESSNSRDLWQSMAWTTIEDKTILDGVDVDKSCGVFLHWVRQNAVKELEGTRYATMKGSWRKRWENIPRYTYYIHVDNQTIQNTIADHNNGVDFTSMSFYSDESVKNSLLVVDSTYLSFHRGSWKPEVRKRKRKGEAIDWNEIDTEGQFRKKTVGTNMLELYYNLLNPNGFESNFIILEYRSSSTKEGVAGVEDQNEFFCAM